MLEQSASLAAKLRWRLAFPTILFMLFSSLDRVNISFAALQMNRELGFTPSQYGFGAGVLFAGFLLAQYPSVLLLQRIGMHRWIACCALLWGGAACATALIHTPAQFYVLRVLLGAAEGGLAPGIVIYLSQFATDRARASTFAVPMLAIPLSLVLGSPLSGWLMGLTFPGALPAWRWMLIAEALPTMLLGVMAWFYFPDRPDQASWLSADEQSWLQAHAAQRGHDRRRNDWRVLQQPLVWASALLWFCLLSGSYGVMFWLPQMIKRLAGLSPFQIGLVTALPWFGAMLGMYYNSAHSDRSGERYWHIGAPAALAAMALLMAWAAGAGALGLAALFVAGLGLGAAQGAFWALPTTLLTGNSLAVGAVAINIVGTAGGLVMPHLIGFALERSGDFAGPTLLIAAVLLLGAALVATVRLALGRTPVARAD